MEKIKKILVSILIALLIIVWAAAMIYLVTCTDYGLPILFGALVVLFIAELVYVHL